MYRAAGMYPCLCAGFPWVFIYGNPATLQHTPRTVSCGEKTFLLSGLWQGCPHQKKQISYLWQHKYQRTIKSRRGIDRNGFWRYNHMEIKPIKRVGFKIPIGMSKMLGFRHFAGVARIVCNIRERSMGMSQIKESAAELIGGTPILKLNGYMRKAGIADVNILAKLEYLNPAGSVKDRIALAMIEDAEKKGILKEGATIIEPTSGNTGIGIAAVAAAKGYQAILTLPDTMSVERRNLLKAYGAKLVLTEGAKGMKGAIERAEELNEEIPGSVILGQFVNPANPAVHKVTTGPEIWEQTDGKVDIFVAGVGTGGTITGVGEYLKEKNMDIQIVAMEPEASPVLSGGMAGAHKIQGIGAGFVPEVLNTEIYDEILTIKNEDAFAEGKAFAVSEGILVGISSGAALKAASILAARPENKGKTIVALLPDSGDRYLSTPLFHNH